MEDKFVAKDIKEVAEKLSKRIRKELPVLKGLLEAMVSSDMDIQILAQAVHTLAVAYPEKSYVFLKGVDSIYKELVSRDKPDIINHDLWKALKKSAEVVCKLHTQEKREYTRQLNAYKSHFTKLKEDDPTINVDECIAFEEPYFRHVECDISSAIKSFIFAMIIGYEPTESQIATLRSMMEQAKVLFEEAIEKKEQALETTKQILAV